MSNINIMKKYGVINKDGFWIEAWNGNCWTFDINAAYHECYYKNYYDGAGHTVVEFN